LNELLSNITEVKKRVDFDDFSSIEDVDSIGRKSNMIFVTESGMYTVIGSAQNCAQYFHSSTYKEKEW